MVKIFGGTDSFTGIIPWLGNQFTNHGSILFKLFIGDPDVFAPGYAGDICFEAGGVFTTGIFVALGVVLPAIFAFYLFMIFMEDSGYLPPTNHTMMLPTRSFAC